MHRQYRGGLRVLVPLDRSLALSIHSWKGDTPIPTTPDRLSGLTSLRPTTLGSSLHFSQHRCSFFLSAPFSHGNSQNQGAPVRDQLPQDEANVFPSHGSKNLSSSCFFSVSFNSFIPVARPRNGTAQVGQAHRLGASKNMVGSGNISGTGNHLGVILHQILPLTIPSSSGKQFL